MDYAAPYRGNFIPSIECLQKHWEGKGDMVFLFPSVGSRIGWVMDFLRSGKKVYFIDRSFFSRKVSWKNIQALRAITALEDIKVIHSHFVSHNYSLFLLRNILFPTVKFVAHLHNNYEARGRLWWLKRYVFKHTADLIIGDSESVTESACQIGIRRAKAKTVRNSIQFDRLNKYEKLDLKCGLYQYVVLMFGYPWYRKGVDVVVRAVNELNGALGRDEVLLAIAQAGGQNETRKGIESTLGIVPSWVKFLPPREDLAAYYNAADIFVSSGREEGLSYSPIEAAYCNCLVICSNIAGNPLDIPKLPVYEKEDPSGLRHKIEETLQLSTPERTSVKQAQRDYVTTAYNIDAWAEEVISCY